MKENNSEEKILSEEEIIDNIEPIKITVQEELIENNEPINTTIIEEIIENTSSENSSSAININILKKKKLNSKRRQLFR